MLRDDSSQFDTVYLFLDLIVSASLFMAALSFPGMLIDADVQGRTALGLMGLGFVSATLFPVGFQILDLYRIARRRRYRETLNRLVMVGFAAIVVQAVVAVAVGTPTSPLFPIACCSLQFTGLLALRAIVWRSAAIFQTSDRFPRNVVIVGSGPRAQYIKQVIDQNPTWRIRIIGFIDQGGPPGGVCVPENEVFKLSDMAGLMADQVVDEVIIACPRSMLPTIIPVVDLCAAAGIPITLLSDLFGDYLPPPQTTRFGALPALSFAPVHHGVIALGVKRCIDVVGASVGLLVTAPVILLAAALIKLTSRGPVFFRQVRCGSNGRHFVMLKLRTMAVDAEERKAELDGFNEMDGPVFKIHRDPRITPIGRLLRRYSIDELPQCWNVLMGDMSLVGPRPPVPTEVAEYETFERRRLSMRPGLTCLWQVSGRNAIGFEDWVRLDLEYIDTWSLGNDIKIMLRTFPAVLSGDGAS